MNLVRQKREEARKEFQRLRREARKNKEKHLKQLHQPQIEIFGGQTLRDKKEKPPEISAIQAPAPEKLSENGVDYAQLYREMRREAKRNKENALKQMREPQVEVFGIIRECGSDVNRFLENRHSVQMAGMLYRRLRRKRRINRAIGNRKMQKSNSHNPNNHKIFPHIFLFMYTNPETKNNFQTQIYQHFICD